MIRVDKLSIQQGDFRLGALSFEVPRGAYAVLMGRTGCGKTTILEAICGLRPIQSGRIFLDGRDVTTLRPAERGVGYVPQDAVLFPMMTVEEHLGFALRIRRWPIKLIRQRSVELAELLGITGLLGRYPEGLSGGEKQRVALGRALSFNPQILCFDEPLSALDEQTREQMCQLLAEVRRKTGATILHVTHNPYEAARLGDVLFHLEAGQLTRLSVGDGLPQQLTEPKGEGCNFLLKPT